MAEPAGPDADRGKSFVDWLADGTGWREDGAAAAAAPRGARRSLPWARWAFAAVAVAMLALASALAGVAAVNPRGEMPWHPYQPLVKDVAYLKLGLWEAHPERPTTIIAGTSRGMGLDPSLEEELRGGVAFNFAFPGGEVPAVHVLSSYLARVGEPPERLVYVLDQFAVRPLGHHRFLDSGAYPLMTGEDREWHEVAAQMPGLLTPGHLRDSAIVLRQTYLGDDGRSPVESVLRPDGGRDYTAEEQAIAAGEVDLLPALEEHYGRVIGPTYSGDRGADPGVVADLRTLLMEAQARGTEVVVVLPPFHPVVLERLRPLPTFAAFQEATLDAVRDACAGGRLSAFDFTDIASFGGTPQAFYDGYHVTTTNADLMLRATVEGLPGASADLCQSGGAAAPAPLLGGL